MGLRAGPVRPKVAVMGVLRKQLWRVPIWVATALFGGWVADLYVPGFHIDGSLTTRLIVGGVVAGLSALAALGATLGLFLPLSALMMIGGRRNGDELVPHPVAKAVSAVVLFAITLVTVPVAAFLAVRACDVVGLPVDLTGGWRAYFAFGMLLHAVRVGAQTLLAPRITNRRVRPWASARLAFLACVVVLWLAGCVAPNSRSSRLVEPATDRFLSAGDIVVAQEHLWAFGFEPGPVNGRYTTETQAAIRAYQARYGIPVSGLLDRATRRELLPGLDTEENDPD